MNTKAKQFSLYCDGACRGNPGPASIGAVLWETIQEAPHEQKPSARFKLSQTIGNATNNVAEYTAVIHGLRKCLKEGDVQHIEICLDSELVVKQLNGQYKVKTPHMRPLFKEAKELLDRFLTHKIVHIRREKNSIADGLANEALDRA